MSPTETAVASCVVAVYSDHAAAERAVRQLHESGFNLGDLSIVGRDLQVTEEPYGLVGRGDYVKAGAESGALFGWLFGLYIGAGFLALPGIGLVVVAGPIAAVLLGAMEGGLAGTGLGSLAGGSSAGKFRKTGHSSTRSKSRGASFSSSSVPSPRSSPAHGACSSLKGRTTSISTSRRQLES